MSSPTVHGLARRLALCLVVPVVFASACPAGAAPPPPAPDVATSPGQPQGEAAPTDVISLATGPRGGTYAEFGRALAELAPRAGAPALVPRTTRGSTDNLELLGSGKVGAALVNMGTVYEAWQGTGPWSGTPRMVSLRAVAPLYPVALQLATLADSPIQALRQLDGKRVGVGVGPAKGPVEILLRTLAQGQGIHPVLVVDTPSLLVEQLLDHRIDALWLLSELPAAALQEVSERAALRLVPLDEASVRILRREYPHMTAYAIVRGTYKGQATAVPTAALWNFLVADASLPEASAYRLARAILGQPAHSRELPPYWDGAEAAIANTFLPYHGGALRYLQERGITPHPASP